MGFGSADVTNAPGRLRPIGSASIHRRSAASAIGATMLGACIMQRLRYRWPSGAGRRACLVSLGLAGRPSFLKSSGPPPLGQNRRSIGTTSSTRSHRELPLLPTICIQPSFAIEAGLRGSHDLVGGGKRQEGEGGDIIIFPQVGGRRPETRYIWFVISRQRVSAGRDGVPHLKSTGP